MGISLLMLTFAPNQYVIIFMIAFIVFYQSTMGPVHWIYIPEICNDDQFRFISTIHYLNGVEIALTTEYFMQLIGAKDIFFMFSLITLLGGLFMLKFVKETKGLTDDEKKTLYWPEEFKNEEYGDLIEEQKVIADSSISVLLNEEDDDI